MNSLIPLHFEHSDIRMVLRDGVPWWVLADLCRVVGIKNHRDVASRLWDWQKDGVGISDAIGRRQKTTVVNEAGAYSVILDSGSSVAEALARWLFTEVLPSIRKHGIYPPPPPLIEADNAHQPSLTSTPQMRFIQECARVAEEQGQPSAEALALHLMSPARWVAMKRGDGSVRQLLKNSDSLQAVVGLGFDLKYIFTGVYAITPQKRRILAGLQRVDPASLSAPR